MPTYTGGFNPAKLADHFKLHGADFGAATPAAYEAMADGFLGGPKSTTTLECIRPQGDILRYNPATEEFGVLAPNGEIRTYFKPKPREHGFPTNREYFNAQCQRTF